MYHSKFTINRQMITDPSQICLSLSNYLTCDGKKFDKFFYRLEWYRIGISISMDVYSDKMPVFQLRPECQLTESAVLEDVPLRTDFIKFKIFVIPYKNPSKNEDLGLDFLKSWFQKKINKAADILDIELGANNRIYYKNKPEDTELKQIQSYSLIGKLKVKSVEVLNQIRQKPIGYYDNLGCGLLLLS